MGARRHRLEGNGANRHLRIGTRGLPGDRPPLGTRRSIGRGGGRGRGFIRNPQKIGFEIREVILAGRSHLDPLFLGGGGRRLCRQFDQKNVLACRATHANPLVGHARIVELKALLAVLASDDQRAIPSTSRQASTTMLARLSHSPRIWEGRLSGPACAEAFEGVPCGPWIAIDKSPKSHPRIPSRRPWAEAWSTREVRPRKP